MGSNLTAREGLLCPQKAGEGDLQAFQFLFQFVARFGSRCKPVLTAHRLQHQRRSGSPFGRKSAHRTLERVCTAFQGGGISHGVWNSFLVIILGLIWQIVLGVKGSEWAWKSRKFASVQQFKDTQRAWGTWGWVLFALNLVFSVIIVLVAMAMIASGELDPDMFNF